MFIKSKNIRMIMDTLKQCTHLDREDRIEYKYWSKLKRITDNECPSCCADTEDNNGVIELQVSPVGVYYSCSDCGEKLTIENALLSTILVEKPITASEVARIVREWNTKKTTKKIEVKANDFLTKSDNLDVFAVKPVTNNKNIKGEEENNNMMNSNKMFKGLDFGKANKDLYRLSHLGLAIKNAEGTFVSYDKANQELVDVDLFDFDLDGMIYKMPVAHNQVVVGDVIIHSGKSMLVQEIKGNNLEVIDPTVGEIKTIMPTKNMFGFNFFTKILCLIDMNNLGVSNDNPFGNMMPMMMMSAMGEGKGNNDMMTMMMMSQMMGGNSQMGDMFSNPMMMMAMMSGDGKMGDMLPMMMMMQGGMFGQPHNHVNNKQEEELDIKEI